ncbi:WNT1-inducible-signaling pathway protein 1 [Acipenser ruthenus]|uniref:CCN family member 3 n=1 Tax=Acipenser ruthenus TaxID=7906 RepID=A0A662YV59_ACIRT|nr:WNT1-inducible-signaling pathway protein 1 [Acipenser ruthenus]
MSCQQVVLAELLQERSAPLIPPVPIPPTQTAPLQAEACDPEGDMLSIVASEEADDQDAGFPSDRTARAQNSTAMPPVTAVTEQFNRTEYCKWPCKCPKSPPRCSAGVSLVMDGCDCCKACARQVGEKCNEADTCDYHKGLYCDYSMDKPRYEIGVCAHMVGVGCEDNGVIYRNGQSFQPNCKYKCMCVNGAIGCVPVCRDSRPPLVWCQNPKRVKVPGKCCEQWICRASSAFPADMVGVGCEDNGVIYRNGQSFQPNCKYKCMCVNGAIGCVPVCRDSRPPLVWCQNPKRVKVPGKCCEQWICDESKKVRKTSPRHVSSDADENEVWHKNCVSQTTPWSPCSKTCGTGLSMRVTNANDQCELVKERRLCNIRPCEVDITKHIKPEKKCLNVYREDEPKNFTISGCVSKKTYRPKYCGVCTDNRCCIPYKSKTIEVQFECPNGSMFSWPVMWINACFCNLSCKNPNDIFADLEHYYDRSEIGN